MGLAVVMLVATFARIAYHLEHRGALDYGVPTVDALYHDQWARSMVGLPLDLEAGEGDARVFEGPSLRPIGYPWWLAGVYALTGGRLTAAILLQHALGLLSVALLWFTLRARVGTWVAHGVSLWWGLHFAPIYFEGELQATSLLIVLQLAGLWAFLRLLETGGGRWAWGAGLLLGLAALVRPNALLPAMVLAAWAALWPRAWQLAEGRWLKLGGFVTALLLGVAPGAIRNYQASGQWIPLTATAGLNLYLGQGPQATGMIDSNLGELGRFRTCFDYPDVKALVERETGRTMNEKQVDAWFRAQALEHMAAQPGRALGLLGTKAALLIHPFEIGHNKEVAYEVRASWVLRALPAPFFLVAGWFLWGVLAGLFRWKTREGQPVYSESERRVLWVHGLWALGFAVSLLPFFAASRYRVPWIPHLLLLGLVAAWPLVRRPDARRIALGLGVAAGLIALLVVRLGVVGWTPYEGPYAHRWHLDRGMTAADQGDLELARAEFDAALESDPGNRTAQLELATLELRAQRWYQAQAGFEAVLRLDPTHPKALFNMGWLAQRQGRPAQALEWYRRTAQVAPTLEVARAAHGQLILQLAASPDPRLRRGPLALRAMQAWLGDRPATPAESELLAACQAEVGDFAAASASARRALEQVQASAPNSPLVGRLQAALARYDRGQPLRLPAR